MVQCRVITDYVDTRVSEKTRPHRITVYFTRNSLNIFRLTILFIAHSTRAPAIWRCPLAVHHYSVCTKTLCVQTEFHFYDPLILSIIFLLYLLFMSENLSSYRFSPHPSLGLPTLSFCMLGWYLWQPSLFYIFSFQIRLSVHFPFCYRLRHNAPLLSCFLDKPPWNCHFSRLNFWLCFGNVLTRLHSIR